MGNTSAPRYVLRDQPFSARLTLSLFLLSVGIGYVSALVQLHLQHAKKGELMPGLNETVQLFHDDKYNVAPPKEADDANRDQRPQGRIEVLLRADPDQKLRPSTQMRTAFTKESEDWDEELVRIAREKKVSAAEAKKMLEAEREGERLAILEWLRLYGPKAPYDKDDFTLPEDWNSEQPITAKYLRDDGKSVKLKSIFVDRCVVCHRIGGEADKVPFESFAQIQNSLPDPPPPGAEEGNGGVSAAPKRQPGMRIEKLAQSTHVHLLGFSMLYGLTGFILAFSRLPKLMRVVLCPLPLLAQVVDIGLWWLARMDKPYGLMFANAIPITGGIVGLGLMLHIVFSLFDMYGKLGKVVLLLLMVGAGAGGYYYGLPLVQSVLNEEKGTVTVTTEEKKVPDPVKKEEPPHDGPHDKDVEKKPDM